jgi:hypothetical protein
MKLLMMLIIFEGGSIAAAGAMSYIDFIKQYENCTIETFRANGKCFKESVI